MREAKLRLASMARHRFGMKLALASGSGTDSRYCAKSGFTSSFQLSIFQLSELISNSRNPVTNRPSLPFPLDFSLHFGGRHFVARCFKRLQNPLPGPKQANLQRVLIYRVYLFQFF